MRVHAKLLQSCLTLCDPMTCSLPSSSVCGILHIRILEWVALLGDLPNPGIEPRCPTLQADSLLSEPPGKPVDRCSNLLYSLVISLCHLHDPRVEGTEDTHSRGDSGVLELLLAP